MYALLKWHPILFDPGRLPITLAALLIVSFIGLAKGPLLHRVLPLYWIGLDCLFGGIGRRLDRRQRKTADLVFRGFFLTLAMALVSYGLGRVADLASLAFPSWNVINVVALSALLTSGAVWKMLIDLYNTLAAKKDAKRSYKQGAYLTLSRSSRIDFSAADDYAVTREAMALAARLFAMGVAAPLFWYYFAGLPAAFIYSGIGATAWLFGKDGFTKGFGLTALKIEGLLDIVPSYAAALIMATGGLFTPKARMTFGLYSLLRRRSKAPYDQGGPVVTAMAGALNASLGGPATDREGSAMPRAWAGPPDATAQLGPYHIRRALYMTVMAHLLLAFGLGLSILWINLR